MTKKPDAASNTKNAGSLRRRYAWVGLGVLALLTIGSFLPKDSVERLREEKPRPSLATLMSPDLLRSGQAFQGFGQWWESRSPLVTPASEIYARATHAFNGSTVSPHVALGNGDWRHLRRDINLCNSAYLATSVERPLRALMANLKRTYGDKFLFLMPPQKSLIYPEIVKPRDERLLACTQAAHKRMRQILIQAAGDKAVPNMTTYLRDVKAKQDPADAKLLFFKQDTHWTPYGGLSIIELSRAYWGLAKNPAHQIFEIKLEEHLAKTGNDVPLMYHDQALLEGQFGKNRHPVLFYGTKQRMEHMLIPETLGEDPKFLTIGGDKNGHCFTWPSEMIDTRPESQDVLAGRTLFVHTSFTSFAAMSIFNLSEETCMIHLNHFASPAFHNLAKDADRIVVEGLFVSYLRLLTQVPQAIKKIRSYDEAQNES